MHNIKRRNSIRVKYTIWMFILGLSILITASTVGYMEYRDSYILRHTEQAYTISRLISSNIDPKNVENYLSEDRYTILDILKNSLNSMWSDMDFNYVLLSDVDFNRINYIYMRENFALPILTETANWQLNTNFDQNYYTQRQSFDTLDVLLPVLDNEAHIGAYVYTQISLRQMYSDIFSFSLKTIVSSMIISALILLISLRYVRRSVVEPIVTVSKAADLFASSHYEIMPTLVSTNGHDEVDYLIRSISKMTKDIKEYIADIEQNIDEKEKMNAELRIAHHIQKSLLPKEMKYTEEFDIFALMNSAEKVGGDFYDFFFVNQSQFAFVIGDVSGKGIPAALFMTSAKEWIKNKAVSGMPPNKVFETVNHSLMDSSTDRMFVTSWMGKVDLENGELTYISAGHPPALLKRRGQGFKPLVESQNKMLVAFEDTKYSQTTIQLEEGDIIFLYTDGATEAEKNSEQFGERRLREALDRNAKIYDNLEDFVRAIRYEIRIYEQESDSKDDLTLLAFRFNKKRESLINHIM